MLMCFKTIQNCFEMLFLAAFIENKVKSNGNVVKHCIIKIWFKT